MLAAIVAGGSLGFLRHGFPPASSFMGDTGSNLLGYLLAIVAVQGSLKTNAALALALPLLVLAVPILDTSFVVAKRLKYRQPIYQADRWHFHHRMANIGFSQRRTLAYLYGWTLVLAGLALALRFVPYSDDRGNFDPFWTAVMARPAGPRAGGERLRGLRARDLQAATAAAPPAHGSRRRGPAAGGDLEAEVDARASAASSTRGTTRPSTLPPGPRVGRFATPGRWRRRRRAEPAPDPDPAASLRPGSGHRLMSRPPSRTSAGSFFFVRKSRSSDPENSIPSTTPLDEPEHPRHRGV